MKISVILRESLKALDGGSRWLSGEATRNSHEDNCHCAATVIDEVSTRYTVGLRTPSEGYFLRAIDIPYGTFTDIWRWNDAPERTYADVDAAFLKAIALAEADGN